MGDGTLKLGDLGLSRVFSSKTMQTLSLGPSPHSASRTPGSMVSG
jgi:hypothetical protein